MEGRDECCGRPFVIPSSLRRNLTSLRARRTGQVPAGESTMTRRASPRAQRQADWPSDTNETRKHVQRHGNDRRHAATRPSARRSVRALVHDEPTRHARRRAIATTSAAATSTRLHVLQHVPSGQHEFRYSGLRRVVRRRRSRCRVGRLPIRNGLRRLRHAMRPNAATRAAHAAAAAAHNAVLLRYDGGVLHRHQPSSRAGGFNGHVQAR